jgi:hypothetical protein
MQLDAVDPLTKIAIADSVLALAGGFTQPFVCRRG